MLANSFRITLFLSRSLSHSLSSVWLMSLQCLSVSESDTELVSPAIVIGPRNTTVVAGREVTLECIANGRYDSKRLQARPLTHTHTHPQTNARTHTHTRTHTQTHTHRHTHKHTYIHIHAHTHTHSNTNTHIQTHKHTQTCTQTHAHARTCTCTSRVGA